MLALSFSFVKASNSHHLTNPRVRGLAKVKIHVYMALSAQIVKRIGAMIIKRLTSSGPL